MRASQTIIRSHNNAGECVSTSHNTELEAVSPPTSAPPLLESSWHSWIFSPPLLLDLNRIHITKLALSHSLYSEEGREASDFCCPFANQIIFRSKAYCSTLPRLMLIFRQKASEKSVKCWWLKIGLLMGIESYRIFVNLDQKPKCSIRSKLKKMCCLYFTIFIKVYLGPKFMQIHPSSLQRVLSVWKSSPD